MFAVIAAIKDALLVLDATTTLIRLLIDGIIFVTFCDALADCRED